MPPLNAISGADIFGIIKPSLDAHTLGIDHLRRLLEQCGLKVCLAPDETADAASYPYRQQQSGLFYSWLKENGITRLCFSYRLDPADALEAFKYLFYLLQQERLFSFQGGLLESLYFAGLPAACAAVAEKYPDLVTVFGEREQDGSFLARLGVPADLLPAAIIAGHPYDQILANFGKEIIKTGNYQDLKPLFKGGYPGYGTGSDTLAGRIEHCRNRGSLPLLRAHAGPYKQDRKEAVGEFIRWAGALKESGFIDILSIGTSQLSQANFGEEWGDRPDGGGVPVNSIEEYIRIYEAAKPMLVRTYAGTNNIPAMARIYEQAINIAWHALSLWWFCRLDGRGPNTLIENLRQHYETLAYISKTKKPYEPNIAHQFAFRGADDITCILSTLIAAKLARRLGIRRLVLQNMLNTPRQTWAVQDLAKARALLKLVRTLENQHFQVYHQPRAGLDYFSANIDEARIQLAAVTALVDDIEPADHLSPAIIHVVSYSEGSHLATPETIIESAKITQYSLNHFRRYRRQGDHDLKRYEQEIEERAAELVRAVTVLINSIEKTLPDPYTPAGLYAIFAAGYLPTPQLWKERERFPHALRWQTKIINGAVRAVDDQGGLLKPEHLAFYAEKNLLQSSDHLSGGKFF